MTEPDCLDAEAQRAKIDELAVIEVPNLVEGIFAASKIAGGFEAVSRILAGLNGPGKLTMHECLFYRVFDPKLPKDQIARFVGQKVRGAQTLALNSTELHDATFDKVIWDKRMNDYDLPHPHLKAVFGCETAPAKAKVLADTDALRAFLSDPANLPLLAKPNFGGRSVGVLRIDGVSDEGLLLHDGTTRPIEAVMDFMQDLGGKGYLFQEVLQPHASIREMTGGGLASLRIVVLAGTNRSVIDNIKIRITGPKSVADTIWRGNFAGAIDPETGRMVRVVRGSGLNLVEMQTHPETGYDMLGFELPDLADLHALTERLARAFPSIGLQGWDIAVTDRGYVPIELNFGGDVKLQQLADGQGAMSDRYIAHLKAAGYKGALP